MSAGRTVVSAEDAAAGSSANSAGDVAVSAGRSAAASEVVTVPEATPEELATILAAYEALWPDPAGATAPTPSPAWRYAGRPWCRRRAWGGWS